MVQRPAECGGKAQARRRVSAALHAHNPHTLSSPSLCPPLPAPASKMCILYYHVHIVLFTRHFLLFTHHIVFFTHHIVCVRTRTHARALVSYYHGLGCARDPAAAAAMYRSAADSKNVEAMVCDA